MSGLNFPTSLNASQSAASSTEKPKAAYWLNVGYNVLVNVVDANGNTSQEKRFISLPLGIGLDNMAQIDTSKTRNKEYQALQLAKNELLASLLARAKQLAPGEERFIGNDSPGQLVMQLRHNDNPAEPVAQNDNPFIMAIKL